eukprot:scaffold16190_cov21-Prasinocladus_malaysianus.AAC.1
MEGCSIACAGDLVRSAFVKHRHVQNVYRKSFQTLQTKTIAYYAVCDSSFSSMQGYEVPHIPESFSEIILHTCLLICTAPDRLCGGQGDLCSNLALISNGEVVRRLQGSNGIPFAGNLRISSNLVSSHNVLSSFISFKKSVRRGPRIPNISESFAPIILHTYIFECIG